MANRFIGSLIVTISYNDAGDYRGTVRVDGGPSWRFRDLHAPASGFNFASDSPEAYDRMASAAVSFGSNYTTHNRGGCPDTSDETLARQGYPSGDVADAIDAASGGSTDGGEYEVRRSADGPVRFPAPKSYRFPTIADVARDLRAINAQTIDTSDNEDDNTSGIDVRLQVTTDGATVHTGDAAYDTDHRGVWGASSVPGNDRRFNARAVARDLIEQAREQAAQSE